jgi:PRC-barrel domain
LDKERTDTFTTLEDAFAGYKVVDRDGEQIGKMDDLFVDENDKPEYIGVKMGFFGTRSTLIPAEITRADEEQKTIEVATEKSQAKDGPTFEDDREITPEFETEVLRYSPPSLLGSLSRTTSTGQGA